MTRELTAELPEQLDWWWRAHLRPRFEGLTDDEYRWEPVPHMWSVRPEGTSPVPVTVGTGPFRQDIAWPPPADPPVTTIAWRLSHLIVGVFGQRVAAHFGGPPVNWDSYDYPGDAATALTRLDAVYAAWDAGVRGLGPQVLTRPCGPAEGPYAEYPFSSLVLHINREALHHGAEVALLRDLYRWRSGADDALR